MYLYYKVEINLTTFGNILIYEFYFVYYYTQKLILGVNFQLTLEINSW